MPPGQPLFESILGFENYPAGFSVGSLGTIGEVQYHGRTNYPISITAASGLRLSLRISYDRGRFDGDAIRRIETYLTEILEAIAENANRSLLELPGLAFEERQQILLVLPLDDSHRRDLRASALRGSRATNAPGAWGERRGPESHLCRAGPALEPLARLSASARGVTETRVGMCLERSAEMVVGQLGS